MIYDYGRLETKNFSRTGAVNNQTYTYGALGDGKNGAGRIVEIIQGNNFKTESFTYDLIGNIIEEKKVITIPQAGPQEFLTEFEYDSWGRIEHMVYPDGEVVRYGYNLTGDLKEMTGQRAGYVLHDILKDALYDGYGNLISYTYGNKSVTNLTYNSNTRRLTNASVDINFGLNSGNLLNKAISYNDQGQVSEISNTAIPLTSPSGNPIGGAYRLSNISYDPRGQLGSVKLEYGNTASGLSGTLSHDLTISTTFHEAGRLATKSIYNNLNSSYNYNFDYTYSDPNKQHKLTGVSETGLPANESKEYTFSYNQMGSITNKTYTETLNSVPKVQESTDFCWTEDQQLSGVLVKDEISESSHAHHYVYDQSGMRVLKTDMYIGTVGVNSNQTNTVPIDLSTVYANAYYIASHYDEVVLASKHYYMGAQRIATNLISYPFDHEDPNLEPLRGEEGQNGYTPLSAGVWQDLNANMQCLFDDAELSFGGDMLYLQSIGEEGFVFDDGEGGEISEPTEIDPTLACEQSLYWANLGGVNCAAVELMYFYHPDYLGSVEFVTDMRGEPYQFFLNNPWGENLENQYAHTYTSFSSRFRFNLPAGRHGGKEWDEETGNFYYGARYYDPEISIWLSVDPLAGEAPQLTPYRFSFNNPLNVVDPNGLFESTDVTLNEDGTYTVVCSDPDDGDNGIYVVDQDGQRTGEVIGESITSHSFVDEGGNTVKGAIIDLNSTEGQDFIDDLIEDDPGLVSYALFPGTGKKEQKHDFKVLGMGYRGDGLSELQYKYRGSVAADGKIGSARDFGNIGAGIVAGRAGLSWESARWGFDGYQGAPEPLTTVKAQRVGFELGWELRVGEPAKKARKAYESGAWRYGGL